MWRGQQNGAFGVAHARAWAISIFQPAIGKPRVGSGRTLPLASVLLQTCARSELIRALDARYCRFVVRSARWCPVVRGARRAAERTCVVPAHPRCAAQHASQTGCLPRLQGLRFIAAADLYRSPQTTPRGGLVARGGSSLLDPAHRFRFQSPNCTPARRSPAVTAIPLPRTQ